MLSFILILNLNKPHLSKSLTLKNSNFINSTDAEIIDILTGTKDKPMPNFYRYRKLDELKVIVKSKNRTYFI